jgi:hypothetical protein
MVVTMISEQSTRPPNAEVTLPPCFHNAACTSRMTWAGLA